MRLFTMLLVVSCLMVGTSTAQEAGKETLVVEAASGAEATLRMTRAVQDHAGRKVTMSVSIRVLSGAARVTFVDAANKAVLAHTGTVSAEELGSDEYFEVSAARALSQGSRAVQIVVVAKGGQTEVQSAGVRVPPLKIDEEDFSDLEALRKAAAELEGSLADAPKVGDDDHAATCTDPTHNHGHDHAPKQPETPAKEKTPKPSPEVLKLRDQIRALEERNEALEKRIAELEAQREAKKQKVSITLENGRSVLSLSPECETMWYLLERSTR